MKLIAAAILLAVSLGVSGAQDTETVRVPRPAAEHLFPYCFPKFEVYDPQMCETVCPELHRVLQKTCKYRWTRHLCH